MADLSVTNDPGQCGAVVSYTAPEGQDNCPGALTTQVGGLASGVLFPVGRTTNTFQVTDSAGNSAGCSFVVTVGDAEPPVISWYVTNVVVVAGTNCQGAMPDLTGMNYVVGVDNCGGVTVTQSLAAETVLGLGTNEVVLGVVDGAGNAAYCTNYVMVVDQTPPVIASVGDKTMECTTWWIFDSPSAVDACGTNTLTVVHTTTNWTCGAAYVATRLWQAVDAFGNSATCTQVVTVVDTTPPLMMCPTNLTVECSSPWSFGTPAAADRGLGGVLVYDNSVNDLLKRFDTGTNEVGNEIILGGEERYLQGFSYEFWSTNLTGSPLFEGTNVTVRLRFYANDGTNFHGYPTPETVLYDSGGFWLGMGTTPRATVVYDEFDLWLYAPYPLMDALPANFTWTVQFSGLGTNDQVGVDLYSPPVIGQSYGDFWLRTDAGWQLRTNVVDMDIAAQVKASTNHVAITVLSTVTNAMCGNAFVATRTWRATDACGNFSDCSQTVTVVDPNAYTNLSISEFMAKNTRIADEDGTYSDWIEIHNACTLPVDLNGWWLTDDPNLLTKWRFPATNIAGGQYLVVWASDKNRRASGAPLHANFKLSDGGEYLALVQPDGFTIASQFYPAFPPQFPDMSYGLPADGVANNYLAWPTPGASNSPGTNFMVMADLQFQPGRGWYTNSVGVLMGTPTAGVTIYYTTNGSVPSSTNGFEYTGPLFFTNTTVLRAAAYRAGYVPAMATHTYVFPDQVVYQTGAGFPTNWGVDPEGGQLVPAMYCCNSNIVNDPQWSNQIPTALLSLPTVSVAMNTDDMFGTNGIYSNPLMEEWERLCSVEYFRPDAQPGFQIDCGIKIHGGSSRFSSITPKHNLRLKFKAMYGAGKLVFDLYPGSPVREFDTLVLHASTSDHWIGGGRRAQMQRDQWCADTQRETGGYGTHGTYVNLYLNGLYWGLYNLGERPDDSYAAHYLGGEKSDYDAIKDWELKAGTDVAWNEMLTLAAAGITNATAYSNMCYYLHVPRFIDYLLINFYVANQDWVPNWWSAGSVTHGVPFHFFSWDAENTFFSAVTNDLLSLDSSWSVGVLYSGLRQYPEFRRLFGEHAQGLLLNGGALSPERCAARWLQRAQEIDLAIIAESARWSLDTNWNAYWYWGGNGKIPTHTDWLEEQNFLLANWFPQRTDILIGQLQNAGLYPAPDAPVFTPHGGIIATSLPVTITIPTNTVLYYTTNGEDPRLTGGGVSTNALVYDQGPTLTLILTNSVELRARACVTNTWTWSDLVEADYALANEVVLRVSHIAHQADGAVKLDFLAWRGLSYTLRASSQLNPAAWEAIATVVPLPDGTASFVDTGATNYPARFYVLTWP